MNHKIWWCAGLFEGEGCFYIHKRGEGRIRAYAIISMTDEDVIRKFHEYIEIGHVWGPYGDYRKKKDGAPRLPQWRWYTTGKNAEKVMDILSPYLCTRRNLKITEIRERLKVPFKSKAQAKFLFANKPEMAKEWASETPDIKKLPKKVKKKKAKRKKK